MKKFQRSALALVLALCTVLSLAACGAQAPAETTAAPTEAAAEVTTVSAETAPSESEIITDLMENYLTQQVFGVEIFRDYGVSMEHSGEPVQSWAVYLTDEEGHCLRSTYHPVIKDQPQLQARDSSAPTPAEAIQALRDDLKAGEIGRGQLYDYLVNDPHGYYCFLSLEKPDQPPKLYGAAFCCYAWSHPFCWLQQETQNEHLQKILEDPAQSEAFFTLSEETYRDQNCLCVSYEMGSTMVRVLDPYSFEKMFPSQDMDYIQSRKVQPVLHPGTPVSVKAYFDPETGACLGEIIDASAAAARLIDMMTTVPNVTEGSGSFVTEKFYLREPLKDLPELEGFQIGQREDLHRVDLNYGKAISGENPPATIQSTYELILDPIVQMYSIRENGKEIALLCPYLYFGMEPWDQYDLQNEFISEQEMLENDRYDIEINTVSMAEVFHYPSMGDQVGYVARVRPAKHKHGVEVFAWDRDTAVKVAESLTIE